MSQNNSNDKAAMLAKLNSINQVEGFDPTPFAVEYTDLNTGESRKRLPVMIQMAWFRLKYPEGRIAVQVTPSKDYFVATARIYPSYKDGSDCYLAEATASRSLDVSKPSVSPREWAQTAAVGIALRNAGFGLQFNAAGDDFEDIAPDELGTMTDEAAPETPPRSEMESPASSAPVAETRELSPEEKLQQAKNTPCPIQKFGGKTLGEVLKLDPHAINWVATKFTGDPEIRAAAKLICEYAVQQVSA